MADRQDLIYRALRNLGALPQGQAPAAEDYASMSALVDSVLAELEAKDIIWIASADAIEDEHFLSLGHILAWKAAPEFGVGSDQALAALAVDAEQKLAEMDRLVIKHNGVHARVMWNDFPTGRGIVDPSTF
jgi:hypothetical protein